MTATGLPRLFSTATTTCEQLTLRLEHYLSEVEVPTRNEALEECKKVLGIPRMKWGAMLNLMQKGLNSSDRFINAETETVEAIQAFLQTLSHFTNCVDLLGRVVPINY